jgi:hypothetical protein
VPGAQDTFPIKINDKGVIVGFVHDSEGPIGHFALSKGQFFNLVPDPLGATVFVLNNFNNALAQIKSPERATFFKGFCSAVF